MTSLYGPGDESAYIKVTLSAGKQLRCKITSGDILFPQCVNCGNFTQTPVALKCVHHLCEECYAKCTEYFCAMHHELTKKEEFQRNPHSHLESAQNLRLECPKCYKVFGNCQKTVDHISKMHPEPSTKNPNRQFLGILDPPIVKNIYNVPFEAQQGTTLSSDVQEQRRPVKKGSLFEDDIHGGTIQDPASLKPARPFAESHQSVTQEMQGSTCPYRNFEYSSFGGKTSSGCETPGDTKAQLREATGPVTFRAELRGGRGEDNCEWSKKTSGYIREIQEKAKELEKKLDQIEEPLKVLTERLERGY